MNPMDQKQSDTFLCFFAWWVFTTVMAFIVAITFIPVAESGQRFADTALGFLIGTGLSMVFVWAFRTTKSAQEEKRERGTDAS